MAGQQLHEGVWGTMWGKRCGGAKRDADRQGAGRSMGAVVVVRGAMGSIVVVRVGCNGAVWVPGVLRSRVC